MERTKVSIVNRVAAALGTLVVALATVCMGASASAEPAANDGTIIDSPELAATLYYPERATRSPGILVLGGAEGGRTWAEAISRQLASHGYVALAESYFNAPGLPAQLQLIPLERFRAGIDRLASDPRVDPRRLAIVGLSKGAEAALVVASRDARIKAVVAGSPSDVVWQGIDRKTQAVLSSWSEDGRPLAFMPFVPCADCKTLASLYEASRSDPAANPKSAIPVENIDGPILMLASERDAVWPSRSMAADITQRLAARHFRHAVQTLQFPDGGHFTLGPVAAEDAQADAGFGGGTPAGVIDARSRSWALVLAFLDRSLRLR